MTTFFGHQMRKFGSLVALCMIITASQASAELTPLATSGVWTTAGGNDAGANVCLIRGMVISNDNSGQTASLTLAAVSSRSNIIRLSIDNPRWKFKDLTQLGLIFKFEDLSTLQLVATSRAGIIQSDLESEQLVPWIHGFTARQNMEVSVYGIQAGAMQFSLSGTTNATNVMSECTKQAGFVNLPRPFVPAEPLQTSSLIAPTNLQPTYVPSAPLNAVIQPPKQVETTIASWSGSDMMTTRPFQAPGPWELQWNSTGLFIARLYTQDGHGEEVASQMNGGQSSSYVPSGGDYYIKITATGQWSMKAVSISQNTAVSLLESTLTQRVNTPVSPPSPSIDVGSTQPNASEEQALIGAVGAAIDHYKAGQSDMQKGAARPLRKQAICAILKNKSIRNWIGKVTVLTTNGDGNGVLKIEIAPNITIGTWNNSLSDMIDNTLIDPSSPVFQTALQLHVGQEVIFSGTFPSSTSDCIEEQSLTMEGSLTEPEFVMKFISISP